MNESQILKEYLGEIKSLTEENERLKIELRVTKNKLGIAFSRTTTAETEVAFLAAKLEACDEHD